MGTQNDPPNVDSYIILNERFGVSIFINSENGEIVAGYGTSTSGSPAATTFQIRPARGGSGLSTIVSATGPSVVVEGDRLYASLNQADLFRVEFITSDTVKILSPDQGLAWTIEKTDNDTYDVYLRTDVGDNSQTFRLIPDSNVT